MLPVNRKIMSKYSAIPRGEQLRKHLSSVRMFEVYPHSTIAVLFNNYTILPYKQKSGRTKKDIIEALQKYQGFLKSVLIENLFLETALDEGQTFKKLKAHEDVLDAIISAYTLLYCQNNQNKCKQYRDKEALFITPI
jgi:predicted RNase H-like nuclease